MTSSSTTVTEKKSMWAPLSEPTFRWLFIAAAASNIGTFMQDIGCAWLMTSLTPSPLMVSLMQTAAFAPFFALALPSGAFADQIDRKKLLALGQGIMGIGAAALGVLTILHMVDPWMLLLITLVLGVGGALSAPAWNALMPELVPRTKLEAATALNSVNYNASRGLGAALGGVVVSQFGAGYVFIINAISFAGVIAVLLGSKHKSDIISHPERIGSAMRAGLRYVRHSPIMTAVFVKSAIFAGSSAAMWALLPLIGREQLKLNAIQYGLLLSTFGVGTIAGAYLMPIFRRRMNLDHAATTGTLIFATGLATLTLSHTFVVAAPGMILMGAAWVITNASLNMGAQMAIPSWVRARAMSVYVLVYQGSVAVGSFLWGAYAQSHGLTAPLLTATLFLAFGLLANFKFRLGGAEHLDTTLTHHWNKPQITHEPDLEHGPVLVTVEYIIDPDRAQEFCEAMMQMKRLRMRDGSMSWHLFCDLAKPNHYVESFMTESWGEHVRQHSRPIESDKSVETLCESFHVGAEPRVVRHMVSGYIAGKGSQIQSVTGSMVAIQTGEEFEGR